MGLTWEEHGSYMGGTTMKEKDKIVSLVKIFDSNDKKEEEGKNDTNKRSAQIRE